MPGVQLHGVHGLRTIDDAEHIAAAFDRCVAEAMPVVVIGGGFIGLEVAATARKLGLEVTVLEGLERLMSRVVAPIVSEAAAQLHRAHGVRLVFGARITALQGVDGAVRAVRTADGREYPAGCVIVGVGVDPEDALARAAGLDCERGIIVDDCARTADPLIVAAGDCCARRRADGSLLRLESVQNAAEQGKSAAAALLGQARPFHAAPWFWSDQYDVKLQMVGLSAGYDQVVTRGDTVKPAFSAFYYRTRSCRGGFTQPHSRSHGGAQAPRSRPVAQSGTGRGPGIRPAPAVRRWLLIRALAASSLMPSTSRPVSPRRRSLNQLQRNRDDRCCYSQHLTTSTGEHDAAP